MAVELPSIESPIIQVRRQPGDWRLAFATTRRFIASHRQTVLNAARAFIETLHLVRTRPDVVVPLLQKFVGLDDEHSVRGLRDYYAGLLPALPRPDLEEGVATLRELFQGKYPEAAAMTEEQIVDGSVIEEIERSGFVKQLQA